MIEIQNKTSRPIRVPLPGGKVLHLGPAKVAQIADHAAEHPALRKLVDDGTIEILGEGERHLASPNAGAGREHTHGTAKPPRFKQGDR